MLLVATLTPLNQDDSINTQTLFSHCHQLLEKGFDGILLFGTTGEGSSFSAEERKSTLEALIKAGIPPEKIMVSAGTAALFETKNIVQHALAQQVHRVLIMPPVFFKNPSDEGILTYYCKLIQNIKSPQLKIYLYHFPDYGASFNLETIRQLKKAFPAVIAGIKDSSGDYRYTTQLLELKKEFAETYADTQFSVFVGNEIDLPKALQAGSDGSISGLANIAPDLVLSMQSKTPQTEALKAFREKIAVVGAKRVPIIKAVKAKEDPSWQNLVRPPLVPILDF